MVIIVPFPKYIQTRTLSHYKVLFISRQLISKETNLYTTQIKLKWLVNTGIHKQVTIVKEYSVRHCTSQ